MHSSAVVPLAPSSYRLDDDLRAYSRLFVMEYGMSQILPVIFIMLGLAADDECINQTAVRFKFWLSAPFLVSEREPHCTLERGINFNEGLRAVLKPRGWIEVSCTARADLLLWWRLHFERRVCPTMV